MLTVAQIKGLLLEEVVLFLLRIAGFRTVTGTGKDPTLSTCAAGLQVRGRGGEHQIDAIADFVIGQPFSYPQRLLVEAKCFNTKAIGLPFIRNAVGVLKDVSEFWISPRTVPVQKNRYHYHFAFFSTTGFTIEAQRYAFAHDIHLLPLAGSSFFAPLVAEIRATAHRLEFNSHAHIGDPPYRRAARFVRASELRKVVRTALQTGRSYSEVPERQYLIEALHPLISACQQLGGAVIAMLPNNLPLFLVPAPDLDLTQLDEVESVRMLQEQDGWSIVSARTGTSLFSFDLPAELFKLYEEVGTLDPSRALDLKENWLYEIQAVVVSDDERTRLLRFRIDGEWLGEVRDRVSRANEPSEPIT